MAKQQSRTQRWANACAESRTKFDDLQTAKEAFEASLAELQDIQSEYQEWLDNLPENLQDSAVAEKLTTITEFDFDMEIDISEADELIDQAEGADLPLGFGRD